MKDSDGLFVLTKNNRAVPPAPRNLIACSIHTPTGAAVSIALGIPASSNMLCLSIGNVLQMLTDFTGLVISYCTYIFIFSL